jgi:N utilization substance protein A
MDSKEILMVVDAVSNEKGIDKEIIFEAIEIALADIDARVAIDRESGDYETFRRWQVIDESLAEAADESDEEVLVFDAPERQFTLAAALEMDPALKHGDYIEEPMDSIGFGRIGAQTAKQVIVQKVREAERAMVVDAYQDRVGELVTGIVKRVEPRTVSANWSPVL